MVTKAVLAYFVIISVLTVVVFGIDKSAAVHGNERIPERVLYRLAFAGGAVGAFAGMKLFHHKTRKGFFPVLMPVLAGLEIAALLAVLAG